MAAQNVCNKSAGYEFKLCKTFRRAGMAGEPGSLTR